MQSLQCACKDAAGTVHQLLLVADDAAAKFACEALELHGEELVTVHLHEITGGGDDFIKDVTLAVRAMLTVAEGQARNG